ncbi:hypothetical protein [Candidatus Arthromitus sp. SFB-rat-Yit]|uniref:hypothetical protein n=1 Tax=Candidatus Arthromitus sp. SFB-rat-Yit TaxID=1041504 RepID=UPI000227A313|nr:hypothetical protein [Candidatus Arthromitus sp. SFB-rat-Yit]BAK81453.1 hypothetical protein RATSFB_0891 [Candidatus Arthromitus sp. SFB-rat-Yit]
MKNNKDKILLTALILGIPTITTLTKSEDSNAMLRAASVNSVKTMASMINKAALIKPPVAPKPSNIKVVNSGLVKNAASLFNNTTTATNKVATVKRTQSVGRLNLKSTFASNLDSLLGATHGSGAGLKKSNSVSVNKLDSSQKNKLSSLLGGGTSSKGYSLDLSNLPKTPPPPPTQSQGTPITSSQQLTTTTTTTNTTPPPIPNAPPLPAPKLSSTNTTTNGAGNLKNQLSNKLSSGLNKTNTTTQTQKQPTPQDDLLKELKTKLQLRTK